MDGTRPYVQGDRAGQPREGQMVVAILDVRKISLCDVCCRLPVYRTTPVEALQYEASIPPVEIALDRAIRRFAVRLWTLSDDHPLLQWMSSVPFRPAPFSVGLLPPDHSLLSGLRRPPASPPLQLDSSPAASSRSYATTLTTHVHRLDAPLGRVFPHLWEPWTAPLAAHPRVSVSLGPREAAMAAHTVLYAQAAHRTALVAYSDALYERPEQRRWYYAPAPDADVLGETLEHRR
ncbi:hypothetical protein CF326_g9589 [Tilletia indica]|nr:hypothetical protein CF326_g9589 [Tilletia indica]